MARKPRLQQQDPTVFAVCSGKCNKRGHGTLVSRRESGTYYARAYTLSKWAKGPSCENCASPMFELYRIAVDD